MSCPNYCLNIDSYVNCNEENTSCIMEATPRPNLPPRTPNPEPERTPRPTGLVAVCRLSLSQHPSTHHILLQLLERMPDLRALLVVFFVISLFIITRR